MKVVHSSRSLRLTLIGLGLVAGSYVIQSPRPLHLEPDSVCYLVAAESIASRTVGSECPGCEARCSIDYPAGYPFFLALLVREDLAGPTSFFLSNAFFLVVGVAAVYGIYRRPLGNDRVLSLQLCGVVLLSFPMFKSVNIPLSEYAFFALAMSCLLTIVWTDTLKGWRGVAAMGLAAILASGRHLGANGRRCLVAGPPLGFDGAVPGALEEDWSGSSLG